MTEDIVFHWAPAAETIDIQLAGVLVLPIPRPHFPCEFSAAVTRLFDQTVYILIALRRAKSMPTWPFLLTDEGLEPINERQMGRLMAERMAIEL